MNKSKYIKLSDFESEVIEGLHSIAVSLDQTVNLLKTLLVAYTAMNCPPKTLEIAIEKMFGKKMAKECMNGSK
ncbi:MAG: hypothetical protein ACFFCW_13610 [Candidatus Hodarchaeota archaeon]